MVGKIVYSLGFLMLAPLPFMNISPNAGLIYGSITLIGIGSGLVQVTTVVRSQGAAIRLGFDDDLPTYLLISGNFLQSDYS